MRDSVRGQESDEFELVFSSLRGGETPNAWHFSKVNWNQNTNDFISLPINSIKEVTEQYDRL